jgi:hypothetical protein
MFAMSAENFRSFRGDNANNLDPQGIRLWDSDRCAHFFSINENLHMKAI